MDVKEPTAEQCSAKDKVYEDESLQMIVNNRDALEYIRAQSVNPFSHEMICELQKILGRKVDRDLL